MQGRPHMQRPMCALNGQADSKRKRGSVALAGDWLTERQATLPRFSLLPRTAADFGNLQERCAKVPATSGWEVTNIQQRSQARVARGRGR
jgi:hypothetical protein